MYISPVMQNINMFKSVNTRNYAPKAVGLPSVSFCASGTPVYLVNREGEYKRYDNRSLAANDMDCYERSIAKCINNPANSINGYYAILASDVEKKDRCGNLHLDETKLIRKMRIQDSMRAVYAIDTEDGSAQRCDNASVAADEFNLAYSTVRVSTMSNMPVKSGYIFVKANEVEKIDKDGNVELDKYKIKELLEAYLKKSRVIYGIKKDGSYTVYDSASDAARKLGLEDEEVRFCVTTGASVKNQKFARTSEIEYYDENMHRMIDTDKIKAIAGAM